MATQVDIPFHGWSFSSQDQSQFIGGGQALVLNPTVWIDLCRERREKICRGYGFEIMESGDGIVQEMLDHGSISFGRYAVESLSWEKHSVFNNDTRQEELDKLTYPGLVAQKKEYFEEYYKKIRALKALEEEKAIKAENTPEILTGQVEADTINEKTVECEVYVSKYSVPEVVVPNELHENECTGKEYPWHLVLRNTTNIVEHGMKSVLDSDGLNTSCVTEVAIENDVPQIECGIVNALQQVRRKSADKVEHELKSTQDSDSFSTCCATEGAMAKDVHQIEIAIVNPLQLVRKKSADKVEHEKKLKQDFDSLSKDWVILKKGMASIGGKKSDESEIENKNRKVASAVTKLAGSVKDTTISHKKVLGQKTNKPQIKSFKELKKPIQKVNSGDTKSLHRRKLSTGGQVAFNTRRPNSLPLRNKPVTRAKTSLPNQSEASRVGSKNIEKSSSNPRLSKGKSTRRSSLDSLIKPTASSSARSIRSEAQRNSGAAKKLLPSHVPKVLKRDSPHTVLPKRRFSSVLAQDKLQRTRSDMARSHMASKIPLHGKKPQQAQFALTSRKQVEPKKVLDLKARSKKLVAPRKEASPSYKRTKQNEDSPLKKKQRHEKPPWR